MKSILLLLTVLLNSSVESTAAHAETEESMEARFRRFSHYVLDSIIDTEMLGGRRATVQERSIAGRIVKEREAEVRQDRQQSAGRNRELLNEARNGTSLLSGRNLRRLKKDLKGEED